MTTFYVVGKGPSLLNLRPEHFDDPKAFVITLNQAIWNVRKLGIPNPILAMQKDGCVGHGPQAGYVPPGPDHECGGEILPLVQPETLVVTTAESLHCVPGYYPRLVLDVQAEFGLPWYSTSTVIATALALRWGCDRIVYIAHDAHTTGDLTRITLDWHDEKPDGGYIGSAIKAEEIALAGGAKVEWLTP